MKKSVFVVAFYAYAGSPIEYAECIAETAQDAVSWARYDLNVYAVEDCFKRVKNWK